MIRKNILFVLIIFALLSIIICSCSLSSGSSKSPSSSSSGGNSSGGSTGISSSSSLSNSSLAVILLPGFYVATNGFDTNSGTNKNAPLLTLQTAVNQAAGIGYTNIYVAAGVYIPNKGLNSVDNGVLINKNNLRIYGGWDAGFNSQSGTSILDGQNPTTYLYHVIVITNVSNIILSNFTVTGGYANSAGFYYIGYGGGMYLSNVQNSKINVIAVSNIANIGGGGIFLVNCKAVSLSGNFGYNQAVNQSGGGIYLANCTSNSISANVASNTSGNGGGGIYIVNSTNNYFSGNVIGNSADINGGGIYDYYGFGNLYTNILIFTNNAGSTGYGGGIYFNASTNDLIYGIILNNVAYSGGGIYMQQDCIYITNHASIYTNTATYWSGYYTNGNQLYLESGSGLYYNTYYNIIDFIPNNVPNDIYDPSLM